MSPAFDPPTQPVPDPPLPLDAVAVPEPDATAEPEGFVVVVGAGDRIHFLDWSGVGVGAADAASAPGGGPAPAVLLIHGLAQTAWTWTPVARRLHGVARVVAMDLRGHGLSDSPTEGYTAETLAEDAVAAAEGSGLLAADGDRVVLAGHGFGAIVAAWAAARLGERCGGLLLVDGGWEDVARTSGLDPDEFLRGLDEPPEVLRSMANFLADRRDFDPATWDADQERSARATVIEMPSKRVVPATRPHAVAGVVNAMFDYDPSLILPSVSAPIAALVAGERGDDEHSQALAEVQANRAAAGRPLIRVAGLAGAGHSLRRYRPREVSAAILLLASTMPP